MAYSMTMRAGSGRPRSQSMFGRVGPISTRPSARILKTITLSTKRDRPIAVPRDSTLEANALDEEYFQLNQEIALLRCDLKPLRERVVRLQRALMAVHGAFIERDERDIEASEAIKYTSAMVELNDERIALKSQLRSVRGYVSDEPMNDLKKEIAEGSEVCALFVASCGELEAQTKNVKAEITGYRHSAMYSDVQAQRKKIMALTDAYTSAKQANMRLKMEFDELKEQVGNGDEAAEAEVEKLIKLNRKLDRMRRIHFDKSEYYISLREKQMKEIADVSAAIGIDLDDVGQCA